MHNRIVGLAGWLKNSFIDFPGTVATTLFFAGCNLRCPFCHNPEIVLQTRDISEYSDQIWEFLHKRRGLIKGVVLSGGEPTLHASLSDLISEIRSLGYAIKLDTNGLLPDRIKDFAPDYMALDIKTDLRNYRNLCQGKIENIEKRLTESIALVKEMKEKAEIRIPCAPGFINKERINSLVPLLSGVSTVYLQRVIISPKVLDPIYFKGCTECAIEDLKAYQSILSAAVKQCIIRE